LAASETFCEALLRQSLAKRRQVWRLVGPYPCSAGGILRSGAILCGGVAYGSDCTLRHINLTLSLRQQIFFF
jgi:hypothetical protein